MAEVDGCGSPSLMVYLEVVSRVRSRTFWSSMAPTVTTARYYMLYHEAVRYSSVEYSNWLVVPGVTIDTKAAG